MTEKEQTLYNLFGFQTNFVNYLINVSTKHKFIYFETPKVGCSTIKLTLQKLEVDDLDLLPEDVHNKSLSPLLSPLQLENKFTEYLNTEYFKFSFVRNPYTRILSCYLDKIVGVPKDIFLPQLGFNTTDEVSFKDFLLAIKKQSYANMDIHWKPQSILLSAKNITLDFIGRQENFDDDLKKALSIITKNDHDQISNERPHAVGANKKLKEYLTCDIISLIQEIYNDDFDLYEYSKDPFNTDQLSCLSGDTIMKKAQLINYQEEFPFSTTLEKKQATNNNDMIVSVCIMSYNSETEITDALNSILIQKVNFKYNIIVSDDCSTDETRKILEHYATKYPDIISLLFQEKNLGVVANFVTTLKACKGKYVAILDADDYWTDPYKLQKQVDFLELNKDYSMVFHNAELHDHTENGLFIKPFNEYDKSREYTADEILGTWSVTTCSVLFINKEQYKYIEKNLWFPVQDLPLYLCCAIIGKIYYMNETMCVYRRLTTGSMNSDEFKSVEIHLTFIEYFKSLYNDFNDILSKKTIDRVSASHYLFAAHKSRKNGNREDYLKYLALAMLQDPQFIYEKEIQANQNSLKKIADKKLESLQNKYNMDIGATQKKLDTITNRYNLMMKSISNLIGVSAKAKPLQKISAYKSLTKTYFELKRVGNEKE